MDIFGFAKDIATTSLAITKDMTDKVVDYANTLTGTKPHNVIHCGSKDSIIRCPNVPLCATFPSKTCEVGTLIAICGTPSANFTRRFHIDFLTDCDHFSSQRGSVALHFNPRFGDNVVVMNSRNINGEWEEEIRSDFFPFRQGVPFNMMILIEEEKFKIAVNGKHSYEFNHRMLPFQNIRRLHIEGHVHLDLVEFRKELAYIDDITKELATISGDSKTRRELKAMLDEPVDVKTVVVPCPTLPYNDQDERFGKPFNIYIAGMIPNYFRRFFVINFNQSQEDKMLPRTIPFHLSIRPEQGTIVRNTMVNGMWQNEETLFDGPFPFVLGTHFDLMLCNRNDKVAIIVNGQLVCEYNHRVDPKLINHLDINGSTLITSLRIEYL